MTTLWLEILYLLHVFCIYVEIEEIWTMFLIPMIYSNG